MLKRIKLFLLQINYKSLFITLFASAVIAFGTHIHANADIPEGGIIGLSLMIENLLGFSYITVNLLINALFCLLAWRLMGTKYMFNVAISTIGFSLFSYIFEITVTEPIFPEKYFLLAALVGSIFIEIGTGITLRVGSAPNGDHALSMALVKRGGLDFGWVNFLRDFTVILFSLCYTDITSVAFALIIMTLTNPLTEYIVKMPGKHHVSKDELSRLTQKLDEQKVKKRKSGMISRTVISLAVVAVLLITMAFLGNPHDAIESDINAFVTEGVSERVLDEDGSLIAYVPEG